MRDEHWAALVRALPELGGDARFVGASARAVHDAALTARLSEVFRGGTAKAFFEQLDEAGVPCEVSSDRAGAELWDDQEALERAAQTARELDEPRFEVRY